MKPASKTNYDLVLPILAFVLGFFGSLVLCGWLMVRFGWDEMAWWEIPFTVLEMLMASATGGLLVACLALKLIHVWRVITGTYECIVCGRLQRYDRFCPECRKRYDNGTLYRPT